MALLFVLFWCVGDATPYLWEICESPDINASIFEGVHCIAMTKGVFALSLSHFVTAPSRKEPLLLYFAEMEYKQMHCSILCIYEIGYCFDKIKVNQKALLRVPFYLY